MLAADAGLLLVAALDALLGRRPLAAGERQAPRVFSVGRLNPIGAELRSLAARPLAVQLTDDLFPDAEVEPGDLPASVLLPPRGRATVRYRLRPRRRGAYQFGDLRLRYPTPLGFFLRQLRIAARAPVRVYPDVRAVRAYDLLARQDREYSLTRAARLRGGESEFERLRDYVRDDEFRAIDWKATARRQKLIAREYQLERNQSVVFVLDCGRLMTAETEGLSYLDHALNAVLMASHVAARSGDRVGLLAFDDRVRSYLAPAGGPRVSQRIIQASYDLHPVLAEPDYAAAFDLLSLRVRRRALVVLFTSVLDHLGAATVASRMRALLPRHLPLCVLFRDVEIMELADPGTAVRAHPGTATATGSGTAAGTADQANLALEPYLRGAAAEISLWRDRFVRDLRGRGCLVLDVAPGQLTPALVNQYLQIKARRLL
jgi:uncharacterized protein (DUF58 family)